MFFFLINFVKVNKKNIWLIFCFIPPELGWFNLNCKKSQRELGFHQLGGVLGTVDLYWLVVWNIWIILYSIMGISTISMAIWKTGWWFGT